jgi:hypothetical protein
MNRAGPRLPNFIMFGVTKSGSTSLHGYLGQHPDVFVSAVKEPGFFRCDDLNCAYSGPGESLQRPGVRDWPGYVRLFEGAGARKAIGEMSVPYLRGGDATAERIHASLPGVRLFAILRQPVDRAYSNYLHLRRLGKEQAADFEQAAAAEAERLSRGWAPFWGYLRDGLYFDNLGAFYRRFGPEQVRVFLYEDWAHPDELLRSIFRFLGVNPGAPVTFRRRENAAGLPRHPILHGAPHPRIRRVLRPLFSPAARRLIWKAWTRLHEVDLRPAPKLDPEVRGRLTSRFREDILRTQELIGRDLSSWLN